MWAHVQFMHFLPQGIHRWQQTCNPRRTSYTATGCPNLSNKCFQNKRQYKGTKAGPHLLLHPSGNTNESSYSYGRGPKYCQQDPPWCIFKALQTSALDQVSHKHGGEQFYRRKFFKCLNNIWNKINWENMQKVWEVSWVTFYFRETSILEAEVC